jgi:hypothetical protein
MLCKKCGFGISNQANFCPKCGEKVPEEMHQTNSTQKTGRWLKILLSLILVGLATAFFMLLISDNMTETVSDQLDAIKEDKLTEAYYSYTSKTFQEATPLTSFREFIEEYPIFSNHKSVRFIDRNTSNEAGTLHAMIMNEDGKEIPVLYQLVKEEDRWLINGIKLDDTNPEEEYEYQSASELEFDSTPLKSAVYSIMSEIRTGNLKKAYEDHTSSDFRTTTTFHDFENFIKENPSFSQNQTVELDDLTFDNNIASITGTLKDAESKKYSAEYNLVEENGQWKIFHVRVWPQDPNLQLGDPKLKFTQFVVGSNVDQQNVITDPRTIFKPESGNIFLNLAVNNIRMGTKVDVLFEHVDSHSAIPPVSKRIMEDGDVTLAFIFTAPTTGWPIGNYRLTAIASSGEKNTYDFKVEK